MRGSAKRAIIAILLAACVPAGCSYGVKVRQVRDRSLLQKMRANVLDSGTVSFRTEQLMRRYDLDRAFRRDPARVLQVLDRQARRRPNPEIVFALAELCHLTGQKLEQRSRPEALRMYLGAAAYAYFYLFDPSVHDDVNQYDPRFRLACDLYNQSLARCIGLAQKERIRLEDALRLEFVQGPIDIRVIRNGFLWNDQDFGYFLQARDYEVVGLDNHYHTYGLGVPLIAVRTERREPSAAHSYYPDETSFPVTAFLRMNCGICDPEDHWRQATLELYDPLRIQQIEVAGRKVPLESDLTTPLGYFLSQARLERLELAGFLRPETVAGKTGLYMLEPYEPSKIPVVLIHGLWSSPMAWMPMFNDLRGDPALRKHYQFWFFVYPTGVPIVYSAALLRETLLDARRTFDPTGANPHFQRMVLVGHSMGGLLGKMMVQESGTRLWELVSRQPIDQLMASPEAKKQLDDAFFFRPHPFVSRVVFIATPHKGSALSQRPIGKIGSTLITLPKALMEMQAKLLAGNPEAFTPLFRQGLPTSIDNLSPDSSVIRALNEMPIDPKVRLHTILGNIDNEAPDKSSDGVVEYTSAHLPQASSEYIVPASHSACQSHPLSVLEVRRILLRHLRPSEDAPPGSDESWPTLQSDRSDADAKTVR